MVRRIRILKYALEKTKNPRNKDTVSITKINHKSSKITNSIPISSNEFNNYKGNQNVNQIPNPTPKKLLPQL